MLIFRDIVISGVRRGISRDYEISGIVRGTMKMSIFGDMRIGLEGCLF